MGQTMQIFFVMLFVLSGALGFVIPEIVLAEVPIYIYTPCVTSNDGEPSLEIPEFEKKMKEAGYKKLEHNGEMEWDADYKIKRAMVYRYVDGFGEATCVVEITNRSVPSNAGGPRR